MIHGDYFHLSAKYEYQCNFSRSFYVVIAGRVLRKVQPSIIGSITIAWLDQLTTDHC